MSYATLQFLLDRYGADMLVELTDRAVPATGVIDEDVIDRAIADAGAAIDGYLAGRYVLPLSSVPAIIADLALSIAAYKLHREVVSEKIKAEYDGALRQLREISQGTIRLNVAGVEPAGAGSAGVRTAPVEGALTRDSLRNFV